MKLWLLLLLLTGCNSGYETVHICKQCLATCGTNGVRRCSYSPDVCECAVLQPPDAGVR